MIKCFVTELLPFEILGGGTSGFFCSFYCFSFANVRGTPALLCSRKSGKYI